MPRAGTYKRTPKKKICWEVRQTPDGFQVFNHTTGIPLCGYWGKREIAEKNGTLHFGCEPTPYTESQPHPDAQAPQAGDGTGPRQQDAVVDVSSPGTRPQRTVAPVDVPQGEIPVEGGAVALPPPAPERKILSPSEARDLICKVFRAHIVKRPVKR